MTNDGRATVSRRRIWVWTMLALVPFASLWSLADPLFASPDEPAHMARAQAFAHFDFSPPYRTDGLPMESQTCYTFNGTITADCAELTWGPDGTEVRTRTRDYPPLFHAVAGVPSLVVSGEAGAYAMRMWMAVVCCALISWGASLVGSVARTRWGVVGPAIALTPMALFVSATVNPSGITVGFATVAVGALAARFVGGDRRRATLVALVLALVGLVLVRRDGVAMAGAIGLAAIPWWWGDTRRWRERWRGRTWTRRDLVIALAVVVAAIVVVVQWVGPVVHRFVTNREIGGDGSVWQGIGVLRTYFEHVIGTFGWVDTFVGPEVYTIAIGVAIAVALVAVASGTRATVGTTALATAMLFVVPVAFGAFRFPYFQGRYLLPVWILAAVAAALAIDRSALAAATSRRLADVVLVVWLGVHAVAFVQNARRYSVGNAGSWNLLGDVAWEPPITNAVAAVWLVAAIAAMVVGTRRVVRTIEAAGR